MTKASAKVAKTLTGLPPDPEGANKKRADWAGNALESFAKETRMNIAVEPDDVVADLIANIMHWCDRNGVNFEDRLNAAQAHYAVETDAE